MVQFRKCSPFHSNYFCYFSKNNAFVSPHIQWWHVTNILQERRLSNWNRISTRTWFRLYCYKASPDPCTVKRNHANVFKKQGFRNSANLLFRRTFKMLMDEECRSWKSIGNGNTNNAIKNGMLMYVPMFIYLYFYYYLYFAI